MDILLEGRRLSRSRIYGYGRRGVATLDWSQARNFSIPLSLTLGLSLKKEGTEGGAVRTGPAAAAPAATGRACVNFTIVFRMRRRHLWMRQRLQRAAAAEEGIGGKEREDKEDIRKDNKSQHPSVHGWRQREGHRHRYRSFLLFRRNAMQMDGRGQEILGTGSERLNDRTILCC